MLLSATEFMVLELLYHKGRTSLQPIGDKILVTSGSITYTVDKLEQKGLLRRVDCSEDRRVTYVELTADGKALFDRIFPSHAEMIEGLMGGLSQEEKAEAIKLLKKLGQYAQEQ